MAQKLYIHATNIHQGGGRSLLEPLLNVLDKKTEFSLTLDERMPLPPDLLNDVRVKRVKPSIFQRLSAERWLARSATSEDIVLCFGNLPPLFKVRGCTVVFLQNRYLIDDVPLNAFALRSRLRLAVERLWLKSKLLNAREYIVQTPSMKKLLENKTMGRVPVRVFPFMAQPRGYMRASQPTHTDMEATSDFLYVASGEPHKNHRKLIEAWCLLAEEKEFPALKLTLDRAQFPELCIWVEQKAKQYQLNVINLGTQTYDQIMKLYGNVGALIYPSTFESFGLPLIEARQAGLKVLAPELDYVRDILDPEQVFDANSEVSIARAVKRFIGKDEQPLPIADAAGFMKCILERV
ncbi:glycosyltransferase family 4 protein [Sideroxydans sp.]